MRTPRFTYLILLLFSGVKLLAVLLGTSVKKKKTFRLYFCPLSSWRILTHATSQVITEHHFFAVSCPGLSLSEKSDAFCRAVKEH